jgi:two-component system, NarL family, nitrate/nitrite response regulator NarL
VTEPTPRIRILLIDDHALFREGLARLLGAEADCEVVAHCASVAEALAALEAMPVDLVLLDIDLGNERGFEFLSRARKNGFEGPVLVVTAGMTETEAAMLIGQGAAGIFLKKDSTQLLAEGIRTVVGGRAWIDRRYLASLFGAGAAPPEAERARLTAREQDVLRGVLDGLANKEIASRIEVSESAVKAVLQQMFHKTGVRTRSQLVRVALERYSRDL